MTLLVASNLPDRRQSRTVGGLSVSRDETSTTIAAIVADVDVEPLADRTHTSPDGMLTIVFTDVEGSTEMLERLGEDRWFQMMLSHNRLVHDVVSNHGGSVVKSQGDGYMITFSSSASALAFAVSLQRAFTRNNPGSRREPVRVRIGVHTGSVLHTGEDLLGKAVVVAARITGRARGGEILVSEDCWDYTAHLGRWRYGRPAELSLKGLTRNERVYPLEWAAAS
jgi:class 3 adenylate cyclase